MVQRHLRTSGRVARWAAGGLVLVLGALLANGCAPQAQAPAVFTMGWLEVAPEAPTAEVGDRTYVTVYDRTGREVAADWATDGLARFELVPGVYEVAGKFETDVTFQQRRGGVEVRSGQTTRVVLPMVESLGWLRVHPKAPIPDAATSIYLVVRDATGREVVSDWGGPEGFRRFELQPGTYTVEATLDHYITYRKTASASVAAGQLSDLTITLVDALGVLTVRGQAPGGTVDEFFAEVYGLSGQFLYSDWTAPDGVLRIELPPGQYRVRLTYEPGEQRYAAEGTAQVEAGTRNELHLTLR